MSNAHSTKVGQLGQSGSTLGQTYLSVAKSIRNITIKSGSPFSPERAGKKRISVEHEVLLGQFLAEEQARGRRAQGIKGLRSRVRAFIVFAEERELDLARCTLADAYAYQGYQSSRLKEGLERDQKITKRTVLSYLIAASALCSWLVTSGRALDNPFTCMHRVRPERRLPLDVLKENEMGALLTVLVSWDDCANLKATVRRYLTHVIAELSYASGLRVSEIAALAERDIDFDRALITVRDGKKGRSRVAFLNDYARDVLELYVSKIRSLVMNGHHEKNANALFFSSYNRLGHVQNEALASVASASGIRATTTHGFRHALGYHLLRAGCGIRYIQAILGHKAIKDTEIYTKVDVEGVRSTLERFHPRG